MSKENKIKLCRGCWGWRNQPYAKIIFKLSWLSKHLNQLYWLIILIHVRTAKKYVFTALGLISSLSFFNNSVMAQNVCISSDTGEVICGKPVQTPETQITKNKQTVNFEDIVVSLNGCKRLSSTIKCNLLITTNKDGWVNIGTGEKAKFFDSYGNEYFAQKTQIGQRFSSDAPGSSMIQGIPLAASFVFEGIPEKVNEVKAIKFGVHFLEEHKIIFRDIPVTNSPK